MGLIVYVLQCTVGQTKNRIKLFSGFLYKTKTGFCVKKSLLQPDVILIIRISSTKQLIVPVKNDVILAYYWSIKIFTGLPLVI